MSESELQREIMKAVTDAGGRVFRNQVGMGWYGHMVQSDAKEGHTIVLTGARPLYAGLCVGSSDLIGWTPLVITPEMVGMTIAVFTAIEVKSKTGRPTVEQLNFIDKVRAAGGLGGIVKSIEDAAKIIKGI